VLALGLEVDDRISGEAQKAAAMLAIDAGEQGSDLIG
jgi:hypothetical protein